MPRQNKKSCAPAINYPVTTSIFANFRRAGILAPEK
jgi:hypothetical protein